MFHFDKMKLKSKEIKWVKIFLISIFITFSILISSDNDKEETFKAKNYYFVILVVSESGFENQIVFMIINTNSGVHNGITLRVCLLLSARYSHSMLYFSMILQRSF